MNKKKIFNDPIYGFITIPSDLIFDIIEHPYFQRLRRIRQLGLTDLIYPGALHTRFHHALGAMHLMGLAMNTLKSKGHDISDKECEAAQIAILLHDIGHGPFSHVLEHTLLNNTSHEKISNLIISELNKEFKGALDLTEKIFKNTYPRKFLHQLVSSQLDIDRLDYLKRDCFFTGVSEGTIGADRIIKMLEIHKDQLVVEEKGIYSIENFLTARRLMYWQVYLHKTTVSAEKMMIQIVRRAKYLAQQGEKVFASEPLSIFLQNDIGYNDFVKNKKYLKAFLAMDDFDIWASIKSWAHHKDYILSTLCKSLLERKLFKIKLSGKNFDKKEIEILKKELYRKSPEKLLDLSYFLVTGTITNAAYVAQGDKINILMKNGNIVDVASASDLPNIKAISKIVKKHYLCWPKSLYLY
ncbi:MAG: HD domain-containing protein [Cytophagaceae bacterium]|nr:HD domain-containing protein [Cytophagaceae bacterium]